MGNTSSYLDYNSASLYSGTYPRNQGLWVPAHRYSSSSSTGWYRPAPAMYRQHPPYTSMPATPIGRTPYDYNRQPNYNISNRYNMSSSTYAPRQVENRLQSIVW